MYHVFFRHATGELAEIVCPDADSAITLLNALADVGVPGWTKIKDEHGNLVQTVVPIVDLF